jgi:hypothetical protein
MGNDPERNRLIEEMRQHTEALNKQRKHEDPRMSFSTPEVGGRFFCLNSVHPLLESA